MTLHWTDLILVLAFVAAGCAAGYLLLLRQLRQIVTERQLKIADQLGALDDAIRALETRLAEHHAIPVVNQAQLIAAAANEQEETWDTEEREGIAPEIQAVIAAATVAALGPDAHVRAGQACRKPMVAAGSCARARIA